MLVSKHTKSATIRTEKKNDHFSIADITLNPNAKAIQRTQKGGKDREEEKIF